MLTEVNGQAVRKLLAFIADGHGAEILSQNENAPLSDLGRGALLF
jgi:hypothetical protein